MTRPSLGTAQPTPPTPRVPAEEPSRPRYTVGSVARALRIVDLVESGPVDGLSVTDVARGLGVSKSSAFALVRTLVDGGYLRETDPGPRYHLGMALVRLGDESSRRFPLRSACLPVLEELSRETGLTTRLAVADHGFPVFIARVDSPGAIRFQTALGVRELPHTSSAGKIIMALLPEADVREIARSSGLPRRTRKTITAIDELLADLEVSRRRGYAIDDEEDVEGVFCVAAAIVDRTGSVVGAVSATGIKTDLPSRRIEELGQAVQRAAQSVSVVVPTLTRAGMVM